MFLLTIAVCLADTTSSRSSIKNTAESLDELVSAEKKRKMIIHENGHQREIRIKPLDPTIFAPKISSILEIDEDIITSAIRQKKVKVSDLVFAQILSNTAGDSLHENLEKRSYSSWLQELERVGANLEQVQKTFDDLYVEVSFVAMDARMQQRLATTQRGR
ncbi:MAG: hypothetical protein SFY81_05130 [Verrucomicrobiota bacterium]|nr:hypothetical protein [Verrucomicrobiota bacterium]